MSDDEIIAIRESCPPGYQGYEDVIALADEALARGAQRDAALMKLDALHVPIPEATVQALLDDAAGHLDTRVRELRERVAQLEAALQELRNQQGKPSSET